MATPAPVPWFVMVLVAIPSSAVAQHWPRQHPTLPLSELVPEALPAPPTPAESGRNERPARKIDRDDGGYTYDATGFTAHVDAEGRVTLRDKSAFQGQLVLTPLYIAFAGTFDATDLIMRWLGEDPYQYEKARFLERTFEERAAMRRLQAVLTMDRALAELPDYLAAVWRQTGWPLELRRRVLFALWDECAETGNSLMIRGGAQARVAIEEFIRAELPADTELGYLPDELARLNQRRTSRHRFSPYDAPDPDPGRPLVAGPEQPSDERPRHSGLAMRAP